ncbi:MAG: hypothetical protein FJ297_01890 [Planctomycetes bacterium]|nr:hypothetical protein [Planctomycetota bacterium]
MNMFARVTVCLAFFVAGALAPRSACADADAQAKRAAVLLYASYHEQAAPWKTAWTRQMEKDGYRVEFLKDPKDLNWELLRQFNVFVTGGFFYDYALTVSPDTVKKWSELLPEYVEAGGGLLVLNGIGGGYVAKDDIQRQWKTLFGAFGVEFLIEQVVDPSHAYVQPRRVQHSYGWTTDVAKHAVMQGVKTVYYPTTPVMYSPATAPLRIESDAWQVVVRGMDTASSRAGTWFMAHAVHFRDDLPGRFAAAPPLAAVRAYGKGRVAAVGLHFLPCLLWQGHPLTDDVCLTRGDGKTPSDAGRLLANLYRWLAEPSVASKQLGGWAGNASAPAERASDLRSDPPIDWTDGGIPETPHAFPGVIGAHSAYSDGSGTVEQWAAAARAAGLKWLVFTETFEKLKQCDWEQLVARCDKASSDSFWAIPGIEAMDVAGNRWVQFGPRLPWLTPNMLDASGQRIRESQNFKFMRGAPPTAPFLIRQGGHPAWSYRFLDSFAVYTVEKNALVDRSLDDYLVKQEQEDEVQPIVVNRLFAPAELASMSQPIPRTWLFGPDAPAARHWFTEPCWRPGRSYISSGPRLLCWDGRNLSRVASGAYSLRGTERWRIRLTVQADAGLNEVRIYDGTKLYARHLAEGTTFDLSFDGLHDQSRRFVAVVTDRGGGELVTPSLLTVDFLGRTQVCSDRNNTMPISIVRGNDGTPYYYPAATMVDKGRPPSTAIAPAAPTYDIALPGMDGGSSWKGYWPDLVPQIPGWDRGGGYFSRCSYPLVGRDVIVQRWDITHEFLPVSGHLRAVLNVTPYMPYRALEYFDLDVREFACVRRDRDMGLVVVEGCLTAKKPFRFDANQRASLPLTVVTPTPKEGENDRFTLALPGQAVAPIPLPDTGEPFVHDGPLPAGSYFACFPDLVGAQGIVLLDDGYSLRVEADKSRVRAAAYISRPGQEMAVGDKLPFRLLCVLGRYAGPADGSEFQWVLQSMGILGPPAYRAELEKGKVLGTKFYLDLEAQDGECLGVIRKTTEQRLPCRLPVRVRGLNPNCSAAAYDRKRNELVPFGFLDGVGYASLDLDEGDADVYIGNLAVCDCPELRLTVVQENGNAVKVLAHNPTSKELKTIVRTPKGYSRVSPASNAVTVPVGGRIEFTVK